MARRTILTLNNVSYLVPDDQTKDLRQLLENIAAWQVIEKTRYGSGPWTIKPSQEPSLAVNFVTNDDIDDGKPKAAEPAEPVTEEVPL